MNGCRNPRRYLLMSLCIATLILGQPSSLPAMQISSDTQQTVSIYYTKVSLEICVPNSFNYQLQNLVSYDEDFSCCIPVQDAAPPLFRQAGSRPPSMRQIWHGLPPLRSPPFTA